MKFLVIGDWGRRGNAAQCAVAEGMARVAREEGCDFIISTGDNFYENGVTSISDAHWQESFECVYDRPELDLPWYVTVGNHDYRGDIESQVEYTEGSRRWYFPDRYYVESYREDEFQVDLFFLDTTPFLPRYNDPLQEWTPGVAEQDTGRQLRWLRHQLARSEASWKIVVGHHPVISGSPYHGSTRELDEQIRPLLEEFGVQFYLCGHEHDLQFLRSHGIHYLISGAGSDARLRGALDETLFAMGALGFAGMELSKKEWRATFYDEQGREAHSARGDQVRQELAETSS